MNFDKKQLEILLINYFRESYNDFPKGILKPSESPDFIVKLRDRQKLGIELTRLDPASKNTPDETLLARLQIRDQTVELARELFEGNSSLKLFVKILFSEMSFISAERQISVVVHMVNLIRKEAGNRNGKGFFKKTIAGSTLPDGIEEILVVNHPALKVSVWESTNNLGVSQDVVDDIRSSIHKKDEKLLKLYQKQRLGSYWLLITTDRLMGVKSYNLTERILNHEFHSNFQQVFLFDLIKSDIYRLI